MPPRKKKKKSEEEEELVNLTKEDLEATIEFLIREYEIRNKRSVVAVHFVRNEAIGFEVDRDWHVEVAVL